jgi:hypothetical protein
VEYVLVGGMLNQIRTGIIPTKQRIIMTITIRPAPLDDAGLSLSSLFFVDCLVMDRTLNYFRRSGI